jgi:hypothetical protein
MYILFAAIAIAGAGCKKQLDVKDTNEPGLSALDNETGIKQAALGVYGYFITADNNQEGGLLSSNFSWYTLTNHEIMGDVFYCPWGNFGWRWINRPASITLDDGTVLHPPSGGDQATEIARLNLRQTGDDNPLKHEWYSMYVVNNTTNLLLNKLSGNNIVFTGGADVKKNTLQAWAYFWKGYVYSRIGSFYNAGLATDTYNATNGDFKSHEDMIVAANTNFDKAIALLNNISSDDLNYQNIMQNVLPVQYYAHIPTPEEWIRNMNTLKARNLLVNKKSTEMTATEWQNIQALANAGIRNNDFIFVIVPDTRITSTGTVPARVTDALGWGFVSERIIQDFKDTAVDTRFHRYFAPVVPAYENMYGRGIQFGTRWQFVDGSEIASSSQGTAYAAPFVYIGGSYEENELMKAEAAIYLGNVDDGLTSIDQVRDFQHSGLPHVSGNGFNATQAKEELRRERRIGLLLRGLAFYDARRWKVINSIANGGGRKGCWVLDADGNLNTNATFEYKYLDYFPVPANELDFNTPNSGAAAVNAYAE